jgi:hypothetical protein
MMYLEEPRLKVVVTWWLLVVIQLGPCAVDFHFWQPPPLWQIRAKESGSKSRIQSIHIHPYPYKSTDLLKHPHP